MMLPKPDGTKMTIAEFLAYQADVATVSAKEFRALAARVEQLERRATEPGTKVEGAP